MASAVASGQRSGQEQYASSGEGIEADAEQAPPGGHGATGGTGTAVTLDDQQQVAVCMLFAGRSVALVGPAGCGKSAVVRAVVLEGMRLFGAAGVLVLSWTGSAAQLVHGRTLSSVLRTFVGDPLRQAILQRVVGRPELLAELRGTKLVIIDEAPTIQARWMDCLEYVLRRTASTLTGECLPFGGRRVMDMFSGRECLLLRYFSVLCGSFL